MKKRVISGITATGNLTLGNYIGSIKNLVKNQDEYEIFMFLADLHGITLPIEPSILKKNIKQQLAIYIACGIDVEKTKLFKQSEINGHTELFYYLSTITNEGQLKRMTQYKDKSLKLENKTETIPLGLLIYPILMASDIILYNSEAVIVGSDQKQHIELTRDLVQRLNKKYKLNFKVPEPIINKVGSRIMALKTPTKKMSKSDENLDETIFLLDSPDEIKRKIMGSLTDDENKVYYDIENKPGVSNLITIYAGIKDISIKKAEDELKKLNYKELKKVISDLIIELLTNIQNKYKNINDDFIRDSLDYNKEYIQKEATKNIRKIRKSFGMR